MKIIDFQLQFWVTPKDCGRRHMLTLVMGGSGSGKSAYAEKNIMENAGNCRKYYIATMQVYDEEGRKKVRKHQKMREDKGFLTIEQPLNIQNAISKMESSVTTGTVALLECMSNLVANEMFREEEIRNPERVKEDIVQGIELLKTNLKDLIIVTNNVFEDGIIYDETTMNYIRAMGQINQELARMADKVIEVVVGIPIIVKEGK